MEEAERSHFIGDKNQPVSFKVNAQTGDGLSLPEWGFSFDPVKLRVLVEWFDSVFDSRQIKSSDQSPLLKVRYYQGTRDRNPHFTFETRLAAVNQFAESSRGKKIERDQALRLEKIFSNMQKLDPWPATLRKYSHTYFCKRDEETGESRISPLTEIPDFRDIVSKQPIGDLFAEGWMEAVL